MSSTPSEGRRLEELFKYFQPASDASGLSDLNIESSQTYDPNLARVSSDPVLNALTQLGVHRLGAHTSFVSLIDDEKQYVVSEMTKSISLVESSHHDENDGICVGTAPLSLRAGVCAGTMIAFTSHDDNKPFMSTPNIYADRTRYIINDFTKDDLYRDRPYVTGYPYMRSYVEVPILTKTGHVIGTYSVVHSEPNLGLNEKSYRIMREIADAVMRHLEMVKLVDDHAKSSRLLQGLNSFVQKEDPVGMERTRVGMKGFFKVDADNARPNERHHTDTISLEDHYEDELMNSCPVNQDQSASNRAIPLTSKSLHGSPTSSNEHLPLSGTQPSSRTSVDRSEPATGDIITNKGRIDPIQPELTTDKISQGNYGGKEKQVVSNASINNGGAQDMIREAAAILREAMGLEGVMFMECPKGKFDTSTRGSITELPAEMAPSIGLQNGGESGISPQSDIDIRQEPASRKAQKFSDRLGWSLQPNTSRVENLSLPETLHRKLLHLFPRGHVFRFDPKSFLDESPTLRYDTDKFKEDNLGEEKNLDELSQVEYAVRAFLPNARSVIFVPLWSPESETWFAGSFGWTCDDRRILQPGDFSYFYVFGNFMIAEISRLELLATDRAKSDFISCISHELRSPLHGILGSAELLREATTDSEDLQLISMIESCGRTLLDTMEHILHYSKVNNISRIKENEKLGLGKSVDQKEAFDLSLLVEETVQSLVTGHQYHVMSESNKIGSEEYSIKHKDGPPVVIISLDSKAKSMVQSDILTWRRCVLNILGNALKYTATGIIEVTLHCQNSNLEAKREFILTVKDTGRGIGQSYLTNHLFRPFMQEDAFSPGTGLGLSIVKSLVDNLDGSVDVNSEEGSGTEVKVSIPVIVQEEAAMVHNLQGLSVCLVGFDSGLEKSIASRRASALSKSLMNHAENWLGMKTLSVPCETDLKTIEARVFIIREEGFPGKSASDVEVPPGSLLLVVSAQHSVQNQMKRTKGSESVCYLAQPFGPRQLSGTIMTALSKTETTAEYISPLFEFPAAAVEPVKKQDPEPSQTPHLLLVDDNHININMLAKCVEKLGYTYKTATDGLQAFNEYASSETAYDYVLMDISMPITNGFESTRLIRNHEARIHCKPTRIIALTGLGNVDAQEEAFSCGMDYFWTKPVKLSKIKALVEEGRQGS